MNWGIYKDYLTVNGETEKERALNTFKEDFERTAELCPSYRCDTKRNDKAQRFLIDSTDVSYKIKVVAFPDEPLFVGDLITAGDEHLIIQECRTLNEMQKVGTAWICNHLFRFQNWNGDIVERWGVLDSGVYSTTLTGNGQVQETDKQFKIYLPFDDDTSKIYIDKRLAVDTRYDASEGLILEVYKVTGLSRVARSYGHGGHILIADVRSDSYSPGKDNIDLLICDYIDPIENPSAPLLCEIQGRDTIPIGFSRKYSVIFFNSENQPDNMVEAIWSIVDLPIGINFEINSNTVTINVSEEISLIGERFKIMVSHESGKYNGTKHVEVTG